MIERNQKTFHDLGFEELMLLKWPDFPKQSTDAIQSVSNYL